jgi:ABC-type uncharacterized transport system permease subunit
MFLLGRLDYLEYTWAIIMPLILFLIVRKFWNFGVKRYSSCN